MCQVHTGAHVSLLTPGKTDYTACHSRNTTTYILHVVPTTTHTHTTGTQVNWKNETKKRKENKGKKRQEEAKNGKEKRRKEKSRKARKDKTRRESKERKREEMSY